MGRRRRHVPVRTRARPRPCLCRRHGRSGQPRLRGAAEAAFWSYGYSTRAERAAFLTPSPMKSRPAPRPSPRSAVRNRPARGPPSGRTRPHHGPVAPVRQPHPQGRISGPAPRSGAARPQAAAASRHPPDGAPHRPRRRLWRLELSAGLLDRGRGHRRGAGRRLPGGGQGAPFAHPGTGEIVAEAIHAAIRSCNLHPGCFADSGRSPRCWHGAGDESVIKAVGFTGSLAGGRALFDLCASRPEPIPSLANWAASTRCSFAAGDGRAGGSAGAGLGRVADHGRGQSSAPIPASPSPSTAGNRPLHRGHPAALERSARRPC